MTSTYEMEEYPEYNVRKTIFDDSGIDKYAKKDDTQNFNENCSLVIPAYNEEDRIGPFLQHLRKTLPRNWEVIIVCDGTDNTANIARSIDDSYRILEFSQRLGKGGAIKAGLNVAHGDVVGYADADGAIPPSEVMKVFRAVNRDTQVSVGSRWVRGSRLEIKQPILRVILGRVYHYMAFALLGLTIKDTQCGIKAFKAETVKSVIDSVTLKNLSFDTAILFHCKKNGAQITEVPIVWSDMKGSKVNPLKTAMIMFLSLLGLRIAHSKNRDKLTEVIRSVREIIENA